MYSSRASGMPNYSGRASRIRRVISAFSPSPEICLISATAQASSCCSTVISESFKPGFRRQVKSMAQKLVNTRRLLPR